MTPLFHTFGETTKIWLQKLPLLEIALLKLETNTFLI